MYEAVEEEEPFRVGHFRVVGFEQEIGCVMFHSTICRDAALSTILQGPPRRQGMPMLRDRVRRRRIPEFPFVRGSPGEDCRGGRRRRGSQFR